MTGVTRRTVRFYVQCGLIPPPAARGPGRHYGKEHVAGILRVQELKRAGKRLDEIKEGRRSGPTSIGAGTPPQETTPRQVTRIRLAAEWIWLEVERGAVMPSAAKLERLADLCRRELGLSPGGEPCRLTVVNRLATMLVIPDGLGAGVSLTLAPRGRVEVTELTPAIENAELAGHIVVVRT